MTASEALLVEALREYEGKIYRDLPSTNSRRFNAKTARDSALLLVAKHLGIHENSGMIEALNEGPF